MHGNAKELLIAIQEASEQLSNRVLVYDSEDDDVDPNDDEDSDDLLVQKQVVRLVRLYSQGTLFVIDFSRASEPYLHSSSSPPS